MALLLVAASGIPLLGAGGIALGILEESARRDAERSQGALAELGGALVRDYVRRANDELKLVGELIGRELSQRNVGPYERENRAYVETIERQIGGLLRTHDIYLDLLYYAQGGKGPELVGQQQRGDYQERQTAFQSEVPEQEAKQTVLNAQLAEQTLSSNEAFVSPAVASNFGYVTLPVAVPVPSGKATPAALVAYLDFRRVGEILAPLASLGYHIRIVDKDGTTVAESGSAEGDVFQQTRPAGYGNLSVEVREPVARVVAALHPLRSQALIWLGLAVALAIGLSVILSRRIVRPVLALTAAARGMEQGNLKIRAGLEREDEIGGLGQAFDRMAAALERLDEAKSDFVASVSHELRTPLTSIRLAIANLLDGVVGPMGDEARATLERLRRDVDRMIRMVNDLLEMARLEAEGVEPRKESVDLAALAAECVSSVEPLAVQKSIAVKVEGRGTAQADPSMVRRIVANLLDNAVKFTPKGGNVSVHVAEDEIRVSDTGPGVGVKDPFGKFVQGTQEGVKSGGVGLGLAIVKKLADLHGASIRLENDRGATFVLRL